MTEQPRKMTDVGEAESFGLSNKYWASMSEDDRALYRMIRPLPRADYSVTIHLHRLEDSLARYEEDAKSRGGTYDLNPDFQRGHVWTRPQRVAFMEAVFRGTAPMTFRFNSPAFGSARAGDINPDDFVCIDGLQRLTTLLMFGRDEFEVFGRKSSGFGRPGTGGAFMLARYHATFQVFAFTYRRDLLQFYVDLNAGGTVHTEDEILRVRKMMGEVTR